MGNFAENLNLGNGFCPPPPPPEGGHIMQLPPRQNSNDLNAILNWFSED